MSGFTQAPYKAFIPLRKDELIAALVAEAPEQERVEFERFCRRVVDLYHVQYQRHTDRLKDCYAPFNPDPDTKSLVNVSDEEKQQRMDKLFDEFDFMMKRANFEPVGEAEIDRALQVASDWGINMDIDRGVFDRRAIYSRGPTTITRPWAPWWFPWWPKDRPVDIYQRLVLLMKLKKDHPRIRDVDTQHVLIKAFKDIPRMDIEMLFPGARIKFTNVDRGIITFPILTAALITAWTFLKPVIIVLLAFYFSKELAEWLGAGQTGQRGAGIAGVWFGITVLMFGYGYRAWYGYMHKKTAYSLRLTESLYYQNIVNNAGVLVWLTDEVEEQEAREALLAYFFLRYRAGDNGWEKPYLDQQIEAYLNEKSGMAIDFEVEDALRKLRDVGIVMEREGRYRAVPLPEARECVERGLKEELQVS